MAVDPATRRRVGANLERSGFLTIPRAISRDFSRKRGISLRPGFPRYVACTFGEASAGSHHCAGRKAVTPDTRVGAKEKRGRYGTAEARNCIGSCAHGL